MVNAIQFISKKYRDNYIVWFQKSHNFVLFKKPAMDIFQMFLKNYEKPVMVIHLEKNFRLEPSAAITLVNDILQKIQEFNTPDNTGNMSNEDIHAELSCRELYSNRKYLLREKIISISFETRFYESILHPLIAHLEINCDQDADLKYEILAYNELMVLRKGKSVIGMFSRDETQFLKGKFFIEMAEIIHGLNESDWLMVVHASAITDSKKTILFSASPGRGKTTFAAMLLKNDFRLISDDFVPIDRNTKAFYFPVAMSVKEGSLQALLPYYPELANKPTTQITPEKKVRFMFDELNQASLHDTYPVKEVVFIEYNPKIPCRFNKITKTDGLMKILEQSFIIPRKESAEIFIKWALKTSYYELIYSDNEKAIQTIKNLFGNE